MTTIYADDPRNSNIPTFLKKSLALVLYPMILGLGIITHLMLKEAGISLLLSTYLPLFMAAGMITFFEWFLPYRQAWHPTQSVLKQDLLYMGLVQILLPKVLTIVVGAQMLLWLQRGMGSSFSLWPHHLSIGIQVILMILIADFLRYWFHRLSHENNFLWKFHLIHHAPSKLYWFNVGRFHPVEKTVQFLLDSLPFLLLGVHEQVFALYFVFYAINGFFQHSNIQIKYGFLNYLISSAELHRWHHSKKVPESNNNYGNNIILWDIVFGTYFNPKNKEVDVLGINKTVVPNHFFKQLRLPFERKHALKNEQRPFRKVCQDFIVNQLLKLQMLGIQLFIWKPLMRSIKNPMASQRRLLQTIIESHQETQFGQAHGFEQIHDYEQFKARVPIQTYETLRAYIETQESGGTNQLNIKSPIMYAQTSGTTGQPKRIPVLKETFKQYKRHQKLFSYVQYRANPESLNGKILGIVSPAVEGYTHHGTPYGSVSGVIYQTIPKIAQSKYVVPAEVFAIEDYHLKYRLILRLALVHKNITCFCSANPSTFLQLLTILSECREEFRVDILQNRFKPMKELSPELQRIIAQKIKLSSTRIDELLDIFESKNEVTFDQLWPNLQSVITWTSGSCGIALESVKKRLSPQTKVVELGYLASEFRGSTTINPSLDSGLPTFQDNFFEFVEKEKWERDSPEFLTMDQLEVGGEYHIFVTNNSGLYRYFMNDLITVTDFFEKTPLIKFVQKGKGVTNITGEKLYENQILKTMDTLEKTLQFASPFFLIIADQENSNYRLLLEIDPTTETPSIEALHVFETYLFELNIEYKEKRASGRLKPFQIQYLKPGTAEAYKQHCLSQGQREGQFKFITLQYQKDLSFDFEQYVF